MVPIRFSIDPTSFLPHLWIFLNVPQFLGCTFVYSSFTLHHFSFELGNMMNYRVPTGNHLFLYSLHLFFFERINRPNMRIQIICYFCFNVHAALLHTIKIWMEKGTSNSKNHHNSNTSSVLSDGSHNEYRPKLKWFASSLPLCLALKSKSVISDLIISENLDLGNLSLLTLYCMEKSILVLRKLSFMGLNQQNDFFFF